MEARWLQSPVIVKKIIKHFLSNKVFKAHVQIACNLQNVFLHLFNLYSDIHNTKCEGNFS